MTNGISFFIKDNTIFRFARKCLHFLSLVEFSDSLSEIKKCDALLICHDVDRGINLNGKAFSPLLDSVRDDLEERGWRCISLNHPWSRLFGHRAWGNPISMNRSYLFCILMDKLRKTISASRGRNNSLCSEFRLYASIIRRAAPRCIISIGAPIQLSRAARSLDVLHVELLHGMGYTTVEWGFDKREKDELPTGILSLDDVSTKTFLSLESLGVKIFQIPHPFIKRFIVKKLSDRLPCEWKSSDAGSPSKYRKEILITMQWGYAGDHGEHVQFSGILTNGLFPEVLIRIIQETNSNILWRFRFHPLHVRLQKYRNHVEFIESFCNGNFNTEWQTSTSMPLPAVLATCSGVIAMSSMSAYDAAYMGVPSLMLCPTIQRSGSNASGFADLETAGYVIKSPIGEQSIRQWVESTEKMPPFSVSLEAEASWEHAVDWMLGDQSSNVEMRS